MSVQCVFCDPRIFYKQASTKNQEKREYKRTTPMAADSAEVCPLRISAFRFPLGHDSLAPHELRSLRCEGEEAESV